MVGYMRSVQGPHKNEVVRTYVLNSWALLNCS